MKGIQTKGEEIANAITHGLGAVLAAVALVFLIIVAAVKGTAWHVVSFSIFGATMLLLYIASTLYHSLTHDRAKFLFRKFDHMSIYLLIAGTYTPFCLTALNGWIGWTIFGVIWGCAIFGVVLKAFYTGQKEMLSTILYVVMGWMGMLAVKPLYDTLSTQSFIFLLLGGAFYTAGTLFFVRDNIRYFHGIWHLFVLAGSAAHFFSIVGLLV